MLRPIHIASSVNDQNTTDNLRDLMDQSTSTTDFQYTPTVSQPSASSIDTVSLAGSGMVFNNTFGSGVTDAFKAAVTAAENFFQAHFTNSVTLNCSFDLQSIDPKFSGQNNFHTINVSYADFQAALASHATTADAEAAVASLPTTDPSNGQGFNIAFGEARILGLAGAGSGIDDTIVLNSNFGWTYGQDAIGVLEHEISEGAMGRLGGLGVQNHWWSAMDLFRYSSAGVRDYTGGADGLPTYFSANGQSLTLQFHNSVNSTGAFDGFDLADWDHTRGDAFGPSGPGAPGTISATDLQVMNVLGWTPPTTSYVAIHDSTTNTDIPDTFSQPYTGPVQGIQVQCIDLSPDNLNIAATAPNMFIHSGSGNDAIALLSGTNVADGGTGSNFLTGGTGTDTFFVDARGAVQDTWSTVNGFHSGDAATLWGVSPTADMISWSDGGGAAGYTGLTLHASAAGQPTASLTLAGFSQADFTTGKLTASFGHDASSGSDYLYVHAT